MFAKRPLRHDRKFGIEALASSKNSPRKTGNSKTPAEFSRSFVNCFTEARAISVQADVTGWR
jgi:hypothetical protein